VSRVIRILLTGTAVLATAATLATGPAAADPSATPNAQDVVGVGTDAAGPLSNAYSAGYNAYLAGKGDTTSPRLYAWDATGSNSITPKTGAPAVTRPDGADTAINLLNTTTRSTVDFADSSRAPLPTDPSTDDFVAYARDGASWAAPAGGNAPANLTTSDLVGIYSCTLTNWDQITDVTGYTGPNAVIKPYLPQASSGTRTFFLEALAGGGTSPLTPGGCVQPYTPQENEGTDPVFTDPNTLVPYSAGQWIGQVYGGHTTQTDAPGPLTIRAIDGLSPVSSTNTLDPGYISTRYGHLLYHVVRNADWIGTTANPALKAIFGPGGWLCSNATARAALAGYGFISLPTFGCGTWTTAPAAPVGTATHAGLTWTVRSEANGEVHVGYDSVSNPYQGDTPASAVLPLLCLTQTGAGVPADITPDFYDGWTEGYLALSAPVSGTSLTSRAAADAVCARQFGAAAREAEFHDGYYGPGLTTSGGWSYWGYGSLSTTTRFWVAINDQLANPWN
jgi:ABC-type phosphate transport system substrate-binding protein